MTRKNILRMCLVTLLLLSVPMVKVDAQQTKIYVDPKSSTISDIGDVFNIEIIVADVNNLTGFEFKLFWDRTLLNVTDTAYTVPDPSWTNPFWVPYLYNEYNATHGLFWLSCFNTPTIPISGDFVLATLTFQVMSLGSCTLNLRDTKLTDPENEQIPHDTIDGEVTTPKPKIYVNPKSSTVSDIGDVFTVKVAIADVTDLYGFELKLGYNTTILDIKETAIQPFLNEPTFPAKDEIHEDEGWYLLAVTSLSIPPGKSGSGTLANITFKATGAGNCTLDLYDTKLVSSTVELIPHRAIDGEVTILRQPDSSFPVEMIAVVIVIAVSFVVALYYVKKKIL